RKPQQRDLDSARRAGRSVFARPDESPHEERGYPYSIERDKGALAGGEAGERVHGSGKHRPADERLQAVLGKQRKEARSNDRGHEEPRPDGAVGEREA